MVLRSRSFCLKNQNESLFKGYFLLRMEEIRNFGFDLRSDLRYLFQFKITCRRICEKNLIFKRIFSALSVNMVEFGPGFQESEMVSARRQR